MSEKPKLFPENLDVFGLTGLRRKKSARDKKYATFNRRMLAMTIDSLFLLFAAPVFNSIAPIDRTAFQNYPINSNDPAALHQWMLHSLMDPTFISSWLVNFFVQMVVMITISGVCWHYWSATPGKMLMRIKIVDANTEGRITDKQIALRLLGYIASGFCLLIGFFWISFDKRHQGWHDKIADTVVITIPWQFSFLGGR